MKQTRYDVGFLLAVMGISLLIGYFIGDNSAKIDNLRDALESPHGNDNGVMRRTDSLDRAFTRNQFQSNHNSGLEPQAATGQLWMSNSMLFKAGVTLEDLELTKALQKRRDAGEFILKDEPPLLRKLQQYDIEAIASHTAMKNAAEYARIFSELAIQPNVSQQLQSHIERIHRASLQAEAAIYQVLEARVRYAQRVRLLLNQEDYSRYKQYEVERAVRFELEDVEKFCAERNVPIDSTHRETLARLIREANSSEDSWWGWWHGPFDPLPTIVMGDDALRDWAEQRLFHVSQSANEVVRELSHAGLPDKYHGLLTEYYARKIHEKAATIKALDKRTTNK